MQNKIAFDKIKIGMMFSEPLFTDEHNLFVKAGKRINEADYNKMVRWGIKELYTNGELIEQKKETYNEKKRFKLDDQDNDDIPEYIRMYKWCLSKYEDFINNLIVNVEFDISKLKLIINQIIGITKDYKNDIISYMALEPEIFDFLTIHTINSTIIAVIGGIQQNIDENDLMSLGIAGLFHDIGMLKVPKLILEKTDKLTNEDILIIQNHTVLGYKYLREIKYSAIIASGALQHHERVDGKGYPSGLTPDRITEIAKIISVIDAYCAAIASKPFNKSPLHAKEVIQDLLRRGGSAYEPSILKELIKNISFYPIGSLVLLSTDKPARVVGTSGVAMKPIVKTIDKDSEGEIFDLSKKNDVYIKGLYSKEEQ